MDFNEIDFILLCTTFYISYDFIYYAMPYILDVDEFGCQDSQVPRFYCSG